MFATRGSCVVSIRSTPVGGTGDRVALTSAPHQGQGSPAILWTKVEVLIPIEGEEKAWASQTARHATSCPHSCFTSQV